MVIFDPHRDYLGKALQNKTESGLKFNLNQEIVKYLHDQFQPFNGIFDCDLSGNTRQQMEFKGTLFRLPLRSQKQAQKSKIKALHYSREEISKLLDIFTRSAGDLLLFTQNIKTIKVYHLPPTSTNPAEKSLLFSVDKVNQKSIPKQMNNKHILKYFLSKQEEELSVVIQFKISVNITENMEQLGKQKATSNETSWLVVWGSSEAKAIKGGVPIGATAVPVLVKDKKTYLAELSMLPDGFYKSSHLFCFLPLPVEINLSFHLNGFFSVEQDRKCLTRKSEDEKASEKVEWNNEILSGAVCNSFINLLGTLNKLVSDTEYNYSHLWPKISSNDKELAEFFKSFYQIIVQADYRLFCHNGQWYSFKECCFLDPLLRFHAEIGDIAFDCLLQFSEDKKVVHIREDIIKCLHAAECTREFKEKVLETETFFHEVFFKNISSEIWMRTNQKMEERDKLTMFALKSKNLALRELVKLNDCIPTKGTGMLRKPEELVHPEKLSASLFDDKDERFPTTLFCEKDTLDALSELGMKTDLIPFEWLKERANSIKTLSKDMALKRCESLLRYLRNLLSDTTKHGYKLLELSNIEFLPLEEKPANWPLTWKGERSMVAEDNSEIVNKAEKIFACPKQLYLQKRKLLIGSTELIMSKFEMQSGYDRYAGVLKAVGVNDDVTVDAVLKQLENVGECSIENMNEAEKKELQRICSAIYDYMNDICKNEKTEMLETKLKAMNSKSIILISDKEGKDILIKPSVMAFYMPLNSNITYDCRPYLYFVNQPLKKYKEFLKTVGVRDKFSSSCILDIINEVKKKFGKKSCSEKDALLVVSIIKLLNDICTQDKILLSDEQIKNLIVPDEKCVLRSPCDLCFDDKYENLTKMSFMKFVHSSADLNLLEMLKIKSKREEHLKSFAGAMDFGQKERLVTRLKGLLKEYPFDSTILNELLQNADDAHASKIHFILDERTHQHTGIFGDSWKPLQGPSLLVYNDTFFTESDIQGIQDLGKGNKSDDLTKTGQFGLGFNATYHLTDVPSFLSKGPDIPNGGTLCIFDPHCNYAPLARPEKPGMQLKNIFLVQKHYPGVYNTYLQKEMPSKKGTWFRFPLRDEEMSKKSEISDKVITINEIHGLYESFLKDMHRALLFVSSVQEIKLSRISKYDTTLKPIYSVNAIISDRDKRIRTTFNQYVKESMENLKTAKCSQNDIPFKEAVYRIKIKDNFKQQTTWLVVQRFGISENAGKILINAVKDGDIGLSPRGGIALPVIAETEFQPVTKVSKKNKSKTKKTSNLKEKQKVSPPSNAVHVHMEMLKFLKYPHKINIDSQRKSVIRHEKEETKTKKKINEQTEIGDFTEKKINEQTEIGDFTEKKINEQAEIGDFTEKKINEQTEIGDFTEKKINEQTDIGDFTEKKINEQTEIGDFKVFCFLPTPISSGLPIHINGHFALDPSRRNMFRDGDEQTIQGKWNTMILTEIIPKAYIRGIEELRDYLMDFVQKKLISQSHAIEIFHLVFPNQTDILEKCFESLVNGVYQNIWDKETAVFPIQNYLSTTVCNVTKMVTWVPLTENDHSLLAYFNDLYPQFERCVEQKYGDVKVLIGFMEKLKENNFEWAKEDSTSLAKLLKSMGLRLVESPLWVLDAIQKASIIVDCISPDVVTQFIKSQSECSPEQCRTVDVLKSGATEVVLKKVKLLLSYCLKSSLFLESMEKLPLLVTEDNELRFFSSARPVYVSCFCNLLPKSRDMFVHTYLLDLLDRLKCKSSSLQILDIQSFAALLPKSINESVCKNKEGICLNQKQEKDIPNPEWLELFWKYLSTMGQQKTLIKLCQNYMKDWCFIPGKAQGEDILVSFEYGHRLMDLSSFSHNSRRKAFVSLQLPEPTLLKSACSNITMKYFLANEQNVSSILNCLYYNVEHLRGLDISDDSCDEILKYLHGNIDIETCGTKMKLQKLPLYKSISGTHKSLNSGKLMIILHNDIPIDGLDIWSQKAGLLLLESHSVTDPLLEKLGAQQCNDLQFYGSHFLPKFDLLDREFIITHLEYIRDKIIPVYSQQRCKEIREQLKLIKFIISSVDNNVLVRADIFYSPFNKIFQIMCPKEKFPPHPFNGYKWRQFMEIAGMKNEITEHMFIDFAKEIENAGMKNGITELVRQQSEALILQLFTEQLKYPSLFENIKHIKFLVPHKVSKKYSDVYPVVMHSSLISFSKSISHRYIDTSWTVCPLLPQYADPKSCIKNTQQQEQIERYLNIFSKPKLENVICHAKNICPALEKKCLANYQKGTTLEPDRETIYNIMVNIYSCFYKKRQQICLEVLLETPIIHVYDLDLFCTPEQIILDISSDDEIIPYLFKAPVKYGSFHELFRFLGSKDKLTCQHYAYVLTAQKQIIRDASMSPEDLSVTRKAVLGFFKEAQKDPNQIRSIRCLYLPSENKKLYKAESLIYCNNESFKQRLVQLGLQYLHVMDFRDERVNVESIFQKLPKLICPKILTDLVKEELVEVSRDEIIEDSEDVTAIEHFIGSSQFIQFVCYLIKHDSKKSTCQITDEQLAETAQNIKSIEFIAVRDLHTLLRYEGEVVNGSEEQKQCFYSKIDGSFKFYFKEDTGDVSKRIRSHLARLISQCSVRLMSDQSFTHLSEVVGLVPDINLIEPYLREKNININAKFEYTEDDWLPPLGSYIPKDEHVLLDNTFIEFRKGEHAAYEIYDPLIDGYLDSEILITDLNHPVYIYVKVIEKCILDDSGEETNPYLLKYKVNMGNGRTESVCVIRLYKFVHKNSTDIVIYAGKQSDYTEAREDETMRRIRQNLIHAWKLNDEKSKKRIIKRLRLSWHPDKNKGNEKFCTKVFQYINEIIRQIENGEINIQTGDGPSYSQWTFTRQSSDTFARTWYSTFGENISSRYHSSWTNYHSHQQKSRSRHHQKKEPNPQEHEARRWLKQAKDDLVVATGILNCRCKNLVNADTSNWVCYISYQAALKAITALTYSTDANKVNRKHQLRDVAFFQPRETLRRKAARLDNLLGNYYQMKYPDTLNFPYTPSQLYDTDKAKEAVRQAQEIVEEVCEHLSQ